MKPSWKRIIEDQIGWIIVRPLATIGLLQALSWLFGLDPLILGWVAHHKIATCCWITAYAIFVHLIWDKEHDRLKVEYNDKIDGILTMVKETKAAAKANAKTRNAATKPKRKESLND